ncbi:MAG: surface lipoprotein assembly modifier [Marinomonas foliarum]
MARLQLGYQYLDVQDNISLTPYLEHYYRNDSSQYLAHGLKVGWQHSLNQQWQVGTGLDTKHYEYTTEGQRSGADYDSYQWDLTASYMPNRSTSLYGGLTLARNKYDVEQASSKSWSVRAGVYRAFSNPAGLFVNAQAIYRDSENDAHDFFLGERRHDKQQIYILSTGAKGWEFAGLSPELRIRHSINESNLDWAYGFEQTEVGVLLRRNF